MSENKQKIISDIYNDPSGFASKAGTLADARKKDNTITKGDVDEFFRKNVEVKNCLEVKIVSLLLMQIINTS